MVERSVVVGSRCAWTMHNFRANLLRRLTDEGWRVVALGADLDDYESRLRAEGFDFRSAPVPMKGVSPLGDVALFWSFLCTFRQVRPRVAHMFTIKPVIYGTLAAALAGVPLRICTITGLGHAFSGDRGLVNLLARLLYRAALSQAHVVFFQNEDDRDLFVTGGLVAESKVRMVPGSGVDLERFQPRASARIQGPTRFLMVSRLLRDKGVMDFVEAAERLTAVGVQAEFHLAGAVDTRNPSGLITAEIARLKASPVKWVGALHDVRPELADADVMVLPSYREGTPRVLLEGMAMAKPIITTDAPGCRQLVNPGVNGFLIPVRDPYYLTFKAQAVNYHPEVILAGRRINDGMGAHVGRELVKAMIGRGQTIRGARVLIMGLAFKENCPDLRNSRVVDIAVELESFGIEVDFHDPWVDEGDARLEYGVRLVANPAPGSYDAVVLAVAHEVFSAMGADGVRALGKPEAVLFDVKAIFPREAADLRL